MESEENKTPTDQSFLETSRIDEKLDSILIWLENSNPTTENLDTASAANEAIDAFGKNEIINELVLLKNQVNEISKSVKDNSYKDDIINRLHDELQKYKGGLRKEFTSPLIKGIIREYDRNIRMLTHFKSLEEIISNESALNLLNQFEITGDALLELLNDNDIESFSVVPGNEFSPREQRSIQVIEITDPEKENIIESVLCCGFRDVSTNRIIRTPEVIVYKLKK
jgi:molecular chaperone GrpE (heat shock protein)